MTIQEEVREVAKGFDEAKNYLLNYKLFEAWRELRRVEKQLHTLDMKTRKNNAAR